MTDQSMYLNQLHMISFIIQKTLKLMIKAGFPLVSSFVLFCLFFSEARGGVGGGICIELIVNSAILLFSLVELCCVLE